MSHVVSVDVEFADLSALKAACKQLGWTFHEDFKTYRWFGRWVDDSPVPDGIFSPEETARIRAMSKPERQKFMTEFLGNCEHKISVPGANYDVGIVRKHNGKWTMLWDWFDGRLHKAMGDNKGSVLRQAYGVAKTTIEARRQGYRVQQIRKPDGTIRLALSK